MKKYILITLTILAYFIALPLISGKVQAAYFKFDQTSYSATVGSTFQVQVVEDAGTETVNSSQAYVSYDPTLLEATIVTAGTFFPTVSNNITSGKVFIVGYVNESSGYETGSGTLATITFEVLKDGTGTLTYDCQAGATNTSKIVKNDINSTNIITCSQNGTATVTGGIGGSSSGGTTPIPTGYYGTTPLPSELPRTGFIEDMVNATNIGMILVIGGVMLRLILL